MHTYAVIKYNTFGVHIQSELVYCGINLDAAKTIAKQVVFGDADQNTRAILSRWTDDKFNGEIDYNQWDNIYEKF